MFENILAALPILFSVKALIFIVLGLTIGFIFGALPGLSSSNAAALVLPMTIGMDLDVALIFFFRDLLRRTIRGECACDSREYAGDRGRSGHSPGWLSNGIARGGVQGHPTVYQGWLPCSVVWSPE